MTRLVGQLVKYYKEFNVFETDFPIIAMKSSISIFEKFNKLRNNNSFAHPNETLNIMETEYAVKLIITTLRLIDSIEKWLKWINRKDESLMNLEMPF